MAQKYWQMKIRGEQSVEEIQSAIGQNGGMLVRIHFEKGETRAYFAADKTAIPKVTKLIKGVQRPTEIRAADLKKIV